MLISGTGKADRDGNFKGFHTDFYKNLAGTFAEWGFTVIRYDKRGLYETEGDFDTAGLSDLVDDAAAVVLYARSLPSVNGEKIVVCGHSEGALIANILSEREKVDGLMLLGGAAMCIKDALYYQNRLLAEEAEHKEGLKGAILRRSATFKKSKTKVDGLFEKCSNTDKGRVFFGGATMNAKWVREHGSYASKDYVEMLRRYEGPVLAITGTKDLSADFTFLDAIKGIPSVECYAPEGVNHILREVDDDNSILEVRKQYVRLSSKPIHAGTEERMRDWLTKNFLN